VEELIKNLCTDFFSKMLIEVSNIEITKELENIYNIKIETPDSGILIWPRWKNLEDIKCLLKLIINKNSEENIIIHLEVNDYLKAKEDKLLLFIKTKVEFVEKSWKEIILPIFTAYERKKIHSFVSDLKSDVYTKSMWEWKERRLHLCKKDKKMTIDVDWNDI